MVTETNDWKTILGWLIAEKPVLYLDDDGKWVEPDWVRSDAAYHLVTKSDGWTFRLKPRTVKIGSREVEAPVLVPAEGQTLWFTNSSGVAQSSMFEGESGLKAKRVSGGRCFASEAAAIAAHEAISALLRGEA